MLALMINKLIDKKQYYIFSSITEDFNDYFSNVGTPVVGGRELRGVRLLPPDFLPPTFYTPTFYPPSFYPYEFKIFTPIYF